MHNFVLSCPIGLENIVKEEIIEKSSYMDDNAVHFGQIEKGIIELECDLNLGLNFNHLLKTPNRILLRLKKQKCRDIPKLYNIIKKYPWKEILNQESAKFNITAKKSRLIHTDKIEKACLDALKDYFQANKIKESIKEKYQSAPTQSIYIRLFEDELTISLDTTGEHLHFRGQNSYRGKAGLRENMAASLVYKLTNDIDKEFNLIDPMCGSGTFLKEARDFYNINQRDFNYTYTNLESSNIELPNKTSNCKLIGFDIDKDVITKAQNTDSITLKQQDLFKGEPLKAHNNIVIINPPYGKRIKIKGDKDTYFRELIDQIKTLYNPIKIGIIIPTPYERNFKGEALYFKQNGISVCFKTII